MKPVLLAALLSLPTLAAAADQAGPLLMPQVWQVVLVDGKEPGWTATLNLSEPGQLFGQAPCNRYSAPLTQEGRSFRLGNLAATRMACPPGIMKIEQDFFDMLGAVRKARLEASTLVLIDAAGKELARLSRRSGE